MFNLTSAFGVKLYSLCLCGCGDEFPRTIHGIMIDKPDYGKQEDTPVIDNCRVEGFSGDGIHLERVWCFSIRHSHLKHNGGSGLCIRGWDGFVLDNWMSGNKGAGVRTAEENASVTMTGNRIEWNRCCGIAIHRGSHWNITGNYIDRSGHCGIELRDCAQITLTGNLIYRSGKEEWTPPCDSVHFRMDSCTGITFTGNTLCCGKDDNGKGSMSPAIGMELNACNACSVSCNTLAKAATQELIHDYGNHKNSTMISGNPGYLYEEETK